MKLEKRTRVPVHVSQLQAFVWANHRDLIDLLCFNENNYQNCVLHEYHSNVEFWFKKEKRLRSEWIDDFWFGSSWKCQTVNARLLIVNYRDNFSLYSFFIWYRSSNMVFSNHPVFGATKFIMVKMTCDGRVL